MPNFNDLDKNFESMPEIIDLLKFDRNLIVSNIKKLMEDLNYKKPNTIKQLSRYTKFVEKLTGIVEDSDVKNILENKASIEDLIGKPDKIAEIKEKITPILLSFRGIYEESTSVNSLVNKIGNEYCCITCKKNHTLICFCCKTNSENVIKLCGDLKHLAWKKGTKELLKGNEALLKTLNKNFEINDYFDKIFTAFRKLYDISSKIAHGILIEDNTEIEEIWNAINKEEIWNAINKHDNFRKFFDNLLFFALISLNHKVTQIGNVNS